MCHSHSLLTCCFFRYWVYIILLSYNKKLFKKSIFINHNDTIILTFYSENAFLTVGKMVAALLHSEVGKLKYLRRGLDWSVGISRSVLIGCLNNAVLFWRDTKTNQKWFRDPIRFDPCNHQAWNKQFCAVSGNQTFSSPYYSQQNKSYIVHVWIIWGYQSKTYVVVIITVHFIFMIDKRRLGYKCSLMTIFRPLYNVDVINYGHLRANVNRICNIHKNFDVF